MQSSSSSGLVASLLQYTRAYPAHLPSWSTVNEGNNHHDLEVNIQLIHRLAMADLELSEGRIQKECEKIFNHDMPTFGAEILHLCGPTS